MSTRLVKQLVNSASPSAATVTTLLGVPHNALWAILHVEATTAGASTVDAKIQQLSPSQTATTVIDVTGAAIDQIPASQTAVGRYLSWGPQLTATAGTSIDQIAAPLSIYQRLSYTLVGTVTNLKIWVEYFLDDA